MFDGSRDAYWMKLASSCEQKSLRLAKIHRNVHKLPNKLPQQLPMHRHAGTPRDGRLLKGSTSVKSATPPWSSFWNVQILDSVHVFGADETVFDRSLSEAGFVITEGIKAPDLGDKWLLLTLRIGYSNTTSTRFLSDGLLSDGLLSDGLLSDGPIIPEGSPLGFGLDVADSKDSVTIEDSRPSNPLETEHCFGLSQRNELDRYGGFCYCDFVALM
ncbi:uncharacterized protein N7496_009587 [Penicillium cataractarum]|uniref:Uncharacterized protein n=1 Tax=Penicillium cataractarum TaxID=2100454 RepID=A0A9W9RRU6_9EURO|nr:uncharacterized protein N7496_009587 [Penicillium cataractarum]KAJ5363874.1 hypothetical protein N7496_009587 [Penicillium cataractarum]